eukprot:3831276-Alexandrium_andersonii.AAC.1
MAAHPAPPSAFAAALLHANALAAKHQHQQQQQQGAASSSYVNVPVPAGPVHHRISSRSEGGSLSPSAS